MADAPVPPAPDPEEVPVVYVPDINTADEKRSVEDVAREVLEGAWGYGQDRRKALVEAGYDLEEVKQAVKRILNPPG